MLVNIALRDGHSATMLFRNIRTVTVPALSVSQIQPHDLLE